MSLAPIALFVYKRLEHTKKTIESLKLNSLAKDSELFIFADGAKDDDSQKQVAQVREYLKTIDGFKSVIIIDRDHNFGLAKSIISGVTEIINKYGKIIVLEDDLVSSPHFLKYMNDSLNFYENNDDVISIHGYTYPVEKHLPETYFIKGADCWGWATWKRGWDLFEEDGQKLLDEIRKQNLSYKFDLNGAYPYTRMLMDQIEGKTNSWAIRWNASAFLNNKLTLYPGVSLIQNIGFDESGTSCGESNLFAVKLTDREIPVKKIAVKESKFALKQIEKFYKKMHNNPTFWQLRVQRTKSAFRKVKNFFLKLKTRNNNE